ncbi:MAG: carboxypeptidase regulatory-like domain-containing protein [Gemmatimonadales bacterium]
MQFRAPLVLALLMQLDGAADAARAQRLQGRLLDLDTDQPLPAGLVTLVAFDGRHLLTAVTDGGGHWAFDVPGPGVYYVSAKRLGYRPWVDGPIDIRAGDTLTAVYHLGRIAVTLDPVEVSAQQMERFLSQAGFYERQRADFGHYITPAEIERRQATRITDLLSALPGVNLVDVAGGVGGPAIQLRGSNLAQGGLCRPRIFVDGILYARGDSRPRRDDDEGEATELRIEEEIQRLDQGISIDDIGHPSTIAAIEVYRSATQVPVQFGGSSVETLCGVIVVWTRAGSMRARR